MAAALQGKTVKEVLYQQQKRDKTSGWPRVPGSSCFSCGQMGHQVAHCPQKQAWRPAQAPNICPRCKKGKHWAKDCHSKTDLQGKPLPPVSGNWVRGQPQCLENLHGWGSLEGCGSRGHKELDTAERLSLSLFHFGGVLGPGFPSPCSRDHPAPASPPLPRRRASLDRQELRATAARGSLGWCRGRKGWREPS